MAVELYHPGLHGVIAGETEISSTDGDLLYRGFSVHDLVDGARFLEVAHLLLCEELPAREQLADFRSLLIEEATLPEPVERFVRDLPLHVGAMDMLRSALSILGNLDPQLNDPTHKAGLSQSMRLMARLPLLIGIWMRVRDGLEVWESTPTLTYAGNLFACITGREPTDVEERSLEAALILSAEHGFTTPTFAARVVASAGGDLYSAVTAATGTLIGTEPAARHLDVLRVFREVRSPLAAEEWVRRRLQQSRQIPGFRPTTYPVIDPRAALLERQCSELAESGGRMQQEEIADAIEQAVWEELQRPPALEWPAARLYDYLGLETDLHLPVFVCGRLVGWCAHILEEAANEPKIRPRARYRGAAHCEFEPLFIRG
jgi:citrate synthase